MDELRRRRGGVAVFGFEILGDGLVVEAPTRPGALAMGVTTEVIDGGLVPVGAAHVGDDMTTVLDAIGTSGEAGDDPAHPCGEVALPIGIE